MVCIWALDDVWSFFWSSRDFGDKYSSISGEELFFALHLNSDTKTVQFSVKTFFVWTRFARKHVERLSYLLYVKKIVVELHPPMLKIGKNCKLPPPNAQHKSASLEQWYSQMSPCFKLNGTIEKTNVKRWPGGILQIFSSRQTAEPFEGFKC